MEVFPVSSALVRPHLCLALGSSVQEKHGTLEGVQWRDTKINEKTGVSLCETAERAGTVLVRIRDDVRRIY